MDTMERGELYEKIQRGDDFALVETLAPESFKRAHLPGAINIPKSRVDTLAPEMIPDKEREIVVYCASRTCRSSEIAGAKFEALGYTNVKDYKGGKADWKEAGLLVEEGSSAA